MNINKKLCVEKYKFSEQSLLPSEVWKLIWTELQKECRYYKSNVIERRMISNTLKTLSSSCDAFYNFFLPELTTLKTLIQQRQIQYHKKYNQCNFKISLGGGSWI